ncbi:Multiple epidermal growth factor-like domains protein 6 [Exaiptasia diaphana]|nr:Multiple epidermal growth factor-like domains protein 6 [Exaiptasia diaphana]
MVKTVVSPVPVNQTPQHVVITWTARVSVNQDIMGQRVNQCFSCPISVCKSGWFGKNCQRQCNCSKDVQCDPVTGSCQCPAGLAGERCDQNCQSGWFGKNCQQQCNCARDVHCDPVNGSCRCPAGRTGERCDQSCQSGWFGKNCQQQCNCDRDVECDPITGSCHCPAGRTGERCDQSKFSKFASGCCRYTGKMGAFERFFLHLLQHPFTL